MVNISIKENKKFYITLVSLAAPIIVQNLINTSLNLVDNVMIGQLGAVSIASVGLANQVFFLLNLILFGVNSGTSIFIAQYWGNKEYKKVKNVVGIGLILGLGIGILFWFASFFFSKEIISLLTDDLEVIELSSNYLKITSFGYILMAISYTLGFGCRSIGKAKIPMYTSAISLAINTMINYLLIFGIGGFPQLGVTGAAIATLIARIVEVTLIVSIVYSRVDALAVKISNVVSIKVLEVKNVMKTGAPVIVNETFWALGMIMYTFVYSHIGTNELASVQVANTINNLFTVAAFGLGSACSVMLGNKLGANKIKEAREYNLKILAISGLLGIVVGCIVIVVSPFIIQNFFDLGKDVNDSAILIMRVMGIYIPVRFIATIIIIGTLRSGGDTVYSMCIEIIGVWCIGVPLAFLGGFVLGLPIHIVFALVSLEEIAKVLMGIPRIKSGKWAKNIIVEE